MKATDIAIIRDTYRTGTHIADYAWIKERYWALGNGFTVDVIAHIL